MTKQRFIAIGFFLLLSLSGHAQQQTFSQEIDFVNHLLQEEAYRDAIFLLHRLERQDSSYTPARQDTLHYLLGWSYYNIKSLDTSIHYLSQVSDTFHRYYKIKFYESFNNSYLGNYEQARDLLYRLELDTHSTYQQLKYFELAGIALLERKYDRFEQLSQQFNYNFYPITKKQKQLKDYHKQLKGIKKKSPLLAGVMSAVIPGSGKFYAGQRWKALSSFITVGTLGAVATENYIRGGPESAQFIISATVFSIFYMGNIWGSVLSVNIKRQEMYDEIDHQIRLDMHIPLRRVFN